MAYYKPQSPIKNGEDYIYPLTTYDQIITSDGSRWNGKQLDDSVIANHLDATEPGYVLDARQGKVLQDAVNGKIGMIDGFATLGASFWTAEGDVYTCTMFHPDVTADNAIIVSPSPGSFRNYCNCGVFCSRQTARQLSFTAAV